MVDFRPFRGWRYDADVVGDLASVLCPPYDLIAPELQESLARRSPYNAVRLEGGERPGWEPGSDSHYVSASHLFRQWREQGVLRRDPQACFYLLRHGFQFQGQTRARLSLIGCVRLEEYRQRQVLPHEHTREPAIRDRVALMQACDANFSPIMGLYRDRDGAVAPVLAQAMEEEPALQVRGGPDLDLTLWQMARPQLQGPVGRALAEQPIYLADGHHRYEAALLFQQQRRAQVGGSSPDATAFNFVMMGLIGFDDPGLLVLPYHRVLAGLAPPALTGLAQRLSLLFQARPLAAAPQPGAAALLEQMASHSRQGPVVGQVGPGEQGPVLLTLRPGVERDSWGPLAVSEAWILEEQVLKPALGPGWAQHVSYVHDHGHALEQVASGQGQMAFLLNPISLTQFEAVVGSGMRLPAKSTFFYPKLPTGLVISQLSGLI